MGEGVISHQEASERRDAVPRHDVDTALLYAHHYLPPMGPMVVVKPNLMGGTEALIPHHECYNTASRAKHVM